MGVDDIEETFGIVEAVDVGNAKREVRRGVVADGSRDDLGGRVDAHHRSRRDALGQVGGDRARPAPYVEHSATPR